MAEAAQWYVSKGIPVFPVHRAIKGRCSCNNPRCEHPGKHPRTVHGFKDASKSRSQVAAWWKQWPKANIGMPTGEASGFLVLDIDPRNGGSESFESLIVKHGRLPSTAEQITGGGGRHVFLRHPGLAAKASLAPGIDVKSNGGYVILAPSLHPSGNVYQWDGIAGAKALLNPAEIPAWLIKLLSGARSGTLVSQAEGTKWPHGERNRRLTSLAGTMRGRGMSKDAVEAALLVENTKRCEPPLTKAEVQRIAASVAKYAARKNDIEKVAAAVKGWTTPVPLLNCAVPPFDVTCIPGSLGEMVLAVSRATETPLGLPALLGIAVVSAAIAKKIVVQPEPGYVEPTNLYIAVGMESGNRKTAVLTRMIRPLVDWERFETERLAPEIKRLSGERKTQEARIEFLRKKAAKAKDKPSPTAEVLELETALRDVPKYPRLWVQDITPEQLAVKMAEQNERIALLSDEGGIFEVLAGRYNKGVPNLDLFLQAHSGSPVRVDRGSRPPVMMQNPALTVGISPQPDVLASLTDKPGFRGRGLLARFLYGLPASLLGSRHLQPTPCPDSTVTAYRHLIERLLKLTPPEHDGAWQPWVLRFSDEAYEAWKDFQRRVEALMLEGAKLYYLKDWASKLPGAAARLAAVFHCVVTSPTQETLINAPTMQRAITLAELLVDHALAVFNLMERDETTDDALKILAWIRRLRQPRFTTRDCFCAHQARLKKVDVIHAPLHLLEQHGYIRLGTSAKVPHRPSEFYEVNPALWEVPD